MISIFPHIISYLGFVLLPRLVNLSLYFLDRYCDHGSNIVVLAGILSTNIFYLLAMDFFTYLRNQKLRHILSSMVIPLVVFDIEACFSFRNICTLYTNDITEWLVWSSLGLSFNTIYLGSIIYIWVKEDIYLNK